MLDMIMYMGTFISYSIGYMEIDQLYIYIAFYIKCWNFFVYLYCTIIYNYIIFFLYNINMYTISRHQSSFYSFHYSLYMNIIYIHYTCYCLYLYYFYFFVNYTKGNKILYNYIATFTLNSVIGIDSFMWIYYFFYICLRYLEIDI